MTPDETRQLGIEFERRVQTMIPEREFLSKLDTQTIYSYLNQFQDKYIHDIYRSLDNIPSGTKISAHVETILQSLLTHYTCSEEVETSKDSYRSKTFNLPEDFGMYVRSTTNVDSSYSYNKESYEYDEPQVVTNQLISQNDLPKLIETPNNSLRILRHPVVVLDNNNTITLVHDRYTNPLSVDVVYYKYPQYFDIMTNAPCELPSILFDDMVTGAVDLYVQYAAGAEANKRRQDEARKGNSNKRSKEDEE